jgi:hypothetical protein
MLTFEEKQKIIFTYAYAQSAIDFIEGALEPLKEQLKVLDDLIMEKAAPTTPIVEAASGNNKSAQVYAGNGKLSSVPIGTRVETPEGNGIITGYLPNSDVEVQMDGGSIEAFAPFDVKATDE